MKKVFVIVIEDDPIVSHVYRSRLEKENFMVEVVADGQAGFYDICRAKPDAVLLDLMLPNLNGIDLLKKIRAMREFEKLPVVVFTNAYVPNMIQEAFSAGASAVYNKSTVTPRQIIDVLTQMLTPPAPDSAAPAVGAPPVASPAAGTTAAAKAPAKAAYMSNSDDAAFQQEQLRAFERSTSGAVSEMRTLLQEISKGDEAQRLVRIEVLFRKVRSFTANAGMAGLPYLAKMGAAVEALIKEMVEKPKNITASTLRTTAHAIDFFAELSKPGWPADLAENPPIEILIVDDEMLSRRAIVYALEKAFLKATSVEDAPTALAKSPMTKFDLIFLDVNMPGMDGFQLCDKLRQDGVNKTTPVIFVTGTADFQVRAQSTLRGASDLIAKPFMFIELTVKALTFALRHRVELHKQNRTASAPASAPAARPTPALEPASLII